MGSNNRIVLNSNNLYLLPRSDKTVGVVDPGRDLNTHNVPRNMDQWRQLGLVGNNARSTHRELEIFGVVISGKKLEDLSTDLINHQCVTNREGFMIMYFNVGADNMYLINQSSVIRRLNDLFDWSKYGVLVPATIQTVWDRFQLDTARAMVDSRAVGEKVGELRKLVEEKEEAKEQSCSALAVELLRKLRDDEVAAKDRQVNALRAAMEALIDEV
ncbi:unnamed protein product [Linum trigynum]|uniref:Uncharacterized protein n=1 Tax=Linum trigynum TaxID=586398 RepID=A0AAV2DSW4_9ROSI